MPPGAKPRPPTPARRPAPVYKPSVAGGDEPTHRRGSGATVYCAIGKTINLGNFETVRVDYGEQHPVNEGETFEEARERARASVVEHAKDLMEFVTTNFS